METQNEGKRNLTRVERAVLEVLVDPKYYKSTNAEKIEAAGVGVTRFYEIIGDPWFQEQQKKAFLDIVKAHVGPIIAAAVETAAMSGRDGHQDRKMLLEMGALYEPKQKQEHSGGLSITFGGEDQLKDEHD